MRDIHKIYVDDEDYKHVHGRAYENFGIDSAKGALVIVRPDQYVGAIYSTSDLKSLENFFALFGAAGLQSSATKVVGEM